MKKNKKYFFQWINERDHNPYAWRKRLNYCIKIMVIFFISLMAYNVFYTNASKLFKINLWLFNISGILLLISIFFIIKYGWKIITELLNIFKRQKNWIRLILVVILVLGIWQIYQNKEDVLNPVLNYINKIEKDYFNPFSIKGTDMGNKTLTIIGINPVDVIEIEYKILYYTNQERKSKGIKELKLDPNLSDIARDHSKDMAENNFFEHTNLKGEDPTDRATRSGYNVHKELGGGWYSEGIGENIGMMPTGDVIGKDYISKNADSIAKAQVESWMESPGHRENILNNTYDLIGVGVAYDGKYYVSTQNFK